MHGFRTPLAPFSGQTLVARILRREKRFLVEVEAGGQRFWAHTNNSGSMLGLLRPGGRALLSHSDNPRRRLAWTLELLEVDGLWMGVNTLAPNRLLKAAHAAGRLPFAQGYGQCRPEARSGDCRLDALFQETGACLPDLWVEAKNVTLVEEEIAYFPDAATERGRKHLLELMALARQRKRAACFFLVQRPDCRCFGPADFIDPEYARLFWQALDAGVEMRPWLAAVDERGVDLDRPLLLAPRPEI